ncbi:unnamed protein product [Prorocentrum cordatum]|uniref:Uncharacterized protein n=1 Tax=Prorocentrum cordatum TaxID=2364126 RepID=A0ABN9UUY5_9DINO|nr:unnamed protein product [Polarella glacialis]
MEAPKNLLSKGEAIIMVTCGALRAAHSAGGPATGCPELREPLRLQRAAKGMMRAAAALLARPSPPASPAVPPAVAAAAPRRRRRSRGSGGQKGGVRDGQHGAAASDSMDQERTTGKGAAAGVAAAPVPAFEDDSWASGLPRPAASSRRQYLVGRLMAHGAPPVAISRATDEHMERLVSFIDALQESGIELQAPRARAAGSVGPRAASGTGQHGSVHGADQAKRPNCSERWAERWPRGAEAELPAGAPLATVGGACAAAGLCLCTRTAVVSDACLLALAIGLALLLAALAARCGGLALPGAALQRGRAGALLAELRPRGRQPVAAAAAGGGGPPLPVAWRGAPPGPEGPATVVRSVGVFVAGRVGSLVAAMCGQGWWARKTLGHVALPRRKCLRSRTLDVKSVMHDWRALPLATVCATSNLCSSTR